MLRSLTSAISGMRTYQTQMDVIGNNIANVNTIGFKGSRVDFADSFSQTLRESSASNGTAPGTSSVQIGTGITAEAIKNVYGQGALSRTGVNTDIAVEGDGFFVVYDSVTDETLVTRAGDFRLDADGYLVTNSGQYVQGDSDGAGAYGNIQITAPAGLDMSSYSISGTGEIKVKLKDGTEVLRGQILLQNFSDPQGLVKRGNNLYSGLDAAGRLAAPAKPGEQGVGKLQVGVLELSNVDLATEFSTMITAQRAFQATARIITTSDEMLQELVNLKR